MNSNHLLFWISSRGSGSWNQFRDAVAELSTVEADTGQSEAASFLKWPRHMVQRFNLSDLGHVEFVSDPTSHRIFWGVVPPCLAIVDRNAGSSGILCGARTPELLSQLSKMGQDVDLHIEEAAPGPDRITIVGRSEFELEQLADKVGLLIQQDAPWALLSVAPPVSRPSRAISIPPILISTVSRFSSRRLTWEQSSEEELRRRSDGLFRILSGHLYFDLLKAGSMTFKISSQVGKYIALKSARKHVVQYESESQTLSFPATCRPPRLISRALVLFSGCLPEFRSDNLRLYYRAIPRGAAMATASLLQQRLR